MQVVLVTGNKEKLKEFKEILGKSVKLIHKDIDIDEIQSVESERVALNKAETAYKLLGVPLIVEDTSLYIGSWNKLPGAMNKWFIKMVGNKGIIKMLSNFDDKSATAETIIAYHDGKTVKTFRGIVKGKISNKVIGKNGFGWDKIFIPEGFDKTQAQLTPVQKNNISSRRKALEKFKQYLSK